MIERLFKLREAGTTVRTEVVAGATTFVTLSYIISWGCTPIIRSRSRR